jgi:hypothetical protein
MSVCKKCIGDIYQEYIPIYDTVEKTIMIMCQELDIKFDEVALNQLKSQLENSLANNRSADAVFGIYKSKLSSTSKSSCNLVDFRFKDSDIISDKVDNDVENNTKLDIEDEEVLKQLKHKWGNLPPSDLSFLEDEYVDWCRRYDVSSKAMEVNVKEICHQQLVIKKKRESGDSAQKDLDSLGTLMGNSALKPVQESASMSAEFNTLGTWIKKFEQEEPFPEVDDGLKDVDGFKKYIRVWFLGHMCKILGIDNEYSEEYDEEVSTYTVDFSEMDDSFDYDEKSDGDK